MVLLEKLSIKRRLILITLLTAGFALLTTSVAVILYEVFSFRQALTDQLIVQAEIIGNNSTAALIFRDEATGREILSALKADPSVMSAALYAADGSVFATYLRSDRKEAGVHDHTLTDGVWFERDHVDVIRGVVLDGKNIGTIALRSDMEEFRTLLKRLAGAVFIIIIVALALSYPLLSGLQKTITGPISVLVEAARTISKDEDYSIRANVHRRDEMGFLADSFNDMLEQIQRRDAQLDQHRRDLEKIVEERTAQLVAAQEELVRKQKLTVLGQLAGSVGHELRNPLGVINNAVYFLKKQLPKADESVLDIMNIIRNEVDNALRIISDLLDFARTKPPQRKTMTVGELIDQSIQKLPIPQHVRLDIDIADTLPAVNVDPLQMKQVFQNLISNAVQAMPKGGALAISARSTGDEGKTAAAAPSSIEISVADTGEGIAPENMRKLFQPLFTTKARGIGFGLTVVKNLTEANGGAVTVDSVVGKGTTFTVVLPMGGDGSPDGRIQETSRG